MPHNDPAQQLDTLASLGLSDEAIEEVTELLFDYSDRLTGRQGGSVQELRVRVAALASRWGSEVGEYLVARMDDLEFCWGRIGQVE